MLTCFQGSTNVVFQSILEFFVRPSSIVLDITYGRGLSWEDLKKNYTIIKVDKRKLFDEVIQIDFNKYLNKKESNSVDCVYFDPPYYFKEKIKQFNIKEQMLNEEEEVFWTEKEFEFALNTLQKEIPRVLKKEGIFIAKMMDGYIGKEYYPNAFKLFNLMKNVLKPEGIFICPIQKRDSTLKLIRTNHIYYSVFKKIKNEL